MTCVADDRGRWIEAPLPTCSVLATGSMFSCAIRTWAVKPWKTNSAGPACRCGHQHHAAYAREHLRRHAPGHGAGNRSPGFPAAIRIAISAAALRSERRTSHQTFRFVSSGQEHQFAGSLRRDLWVARCEWRRQNDHYQDALRSSRAFFRPHGTRRRKGQPTIRTGAGARRLYVPEILALRRPDHRGESRILRRRLCRAAGGAWEQEELGTGILRGLKARSARLRVACPGAGNSVSRSGPRFCTSRAFSFWTSLLRASIHSRGAPSGA